MRRLLVVALVTFMAAGVANAQQVIQPEPLGFPTDGYVPTQGRDTFAYLEDTLGNSFWPAGNYGYHGSLDDITFGSPTLAPTHMTSFQVGWFSRITAGLTPLSMTVNFYSYFTDNYYGYAGYPFVGAKYGPTFTVTGLGTGLHYGATATVVDVGAPPVWLPCGTWMEIGFFDSLGNPAVDTGLLLANDWGAEAGNTSRDIFGLTAPLGNVLTAYAWFGGYTPTLPSSDPNWNPASNFLVGISVPEPLTLGLVAIGGLLAVRRRR
jgi:hypothetical protein